ncbi:hypothetical protein BS78_08G161200 [Paspalum vaginatum]|nr:hypothetical protein BS78_08G161200 [Paspalum vaginatum]
MLKGVLSALARAGGDRRFSFLSSYVDPRWKACREYYGPIARGCPRQLIKSLICWWRSVHLILPTYSLLSDEVQLFNPPRELHFVRACVYAAGEFKGLFGSRLNFSTRYIGCLDAV